MDNNEQEGDVIDQSIHGEESYERTIFTPVRFSESSGVDPFVLKQSILKLQHMIALNDNLTNDLLFDVSERIRKYQSKRKLYILEEIELINLYNACNTYSNIDYNNDIDLLVVPGCVSRHSSRYMCNTIQSFQNIWEGYFPQGFDCIFEQGWVVAGGSCLSHVIYQRKNNMKMVNLHLVSNSTNFIFDEVMENLLTTVSLLYSVPQECNTDKRSGFDKSNRLVNIHRTNKAIYIQCLNWPTIKIDVCQYDSFEAVLDSYRVGAEKLIYDGEKVITDAIGVLAMKEGINLFCHVNDDWQSQLLLYEYYNKGFSIAFPHFNTELLINQLRDDINKSSTDLIAKEVCVGRLKLTIAFANDVSAKLDMICTIDSEHLPNEWIVHYNRFPHLLRLNDIAIYNISVLLRGDLHESVVSVSPKQLNKCLSKYIDIDSEHESVDSVITWKAKDPSQSLFTLLKEISIDLKIAKQTLNELRVSHEFNRDTLARLFGERLSDRLLECDTESAFINIWDEILSAFFHNESLHCTIVNGKIIIKLPFTVTQKTGMYSRLYGVYGC